MTEEELQGLIKTLDKKQYSQRQREQDCAAILAAFAELRAERDAALERIKELELYASDTDFDRNDMTRQLNAALEQVELLLRGTIQYVELLRQ